VRSTVDKPRDVIHPYPANAPQITMSFSSSAQQQNAPIHCATVTGESVWLTCAGRRPTHMGYMGNMGYMDIVELTCAGRRPTHMGYMGNMGYMDIVELTCAGRRPTRGQAGHRQRTGACTCRRCARHMSSSATGKRVGCPGRSCCQGGLSQKSPACHRTRPSGRLEVPAEHRCPTHPCGNVPRAARAARQHTQHAQHVQHAPRCRATSRNGSK
jgi:hypothetical protein